MTDPASPLVESTPSRSRRRWPIAMMLFAFCCGLYFFTYSGTPISNDEQILFDGVHSLVQHGNTWLSYTNDARPWSTLPNNTPLPSVDSEPGQIYAAIPLFLIAQLLPGWGLMQTVWLLNILITALIVVGFFYYAIALGYRDSVATGTALLLATGTMLWPYSKTFFREPLSALLILLTAYCLMQARRYWGSQQWRWLSGFGLTFSAAIVTKTTAILLVPALIGIAWPVRRVPRHSLRTPIRRRSLVIAAGFSIVMLSVILTLVLIFGQRYGLPTLFNRFWSSRDQALYALISYFASPGRSLWAFSPILLIGLPGFVWLWQEKAWRQIAVPLLAIGGFAVGYAAFQNYDWYGGLAWGPRYLLVVVPFAALWLLPVMSRLLNRQAGRLLPILTAALIAISVGVQVLGVLPIHAYYDYLSAENTRLGLPSDTINGWQAGTWIPQYIPTVVLTKLAAGGQAGSDLAWPQVNGAWPIGILCMVLCGSTLTRLIILSRRTRDFNRSTQVRSHIMQHIVPLGWPGACVALIAIGITVYQNDPRYADYPGVRGALSALAKNLHPGDGVLLNDTSYRLTFMNFYKAPQPIMLLPDSPGEVAIPGQVPAVTDPDGSQPDSLVAAVLPVRLARYGLFTTHWWLVTEFIPADPNRLRVTERYLTRHYFPTGEVYTSDRLRIVGFSPMVAPPDIFPPWPSVRSGVTFGNRFTLVGYDAPSTVTVNAQHVTTLPISLLWKFDGWPSGAQPFDYSLNISLIDPHGAVVPGAQQAGLPQATFGLTSQWVANGYYRDNHGLQLPANLAPGAYQVWVLWYDWRNNQRLTTNGTPAADHLVLYTLNVNAR